MRVSGTRDLVYKVSKVESHPSFAKATEGQARLQVKSHPSFAKATEGQARRQVESQTLSRKMGIYKTFLFI